MVSLFTLGVSFFSGVAFAFGGYWCLLLGAVLSLFASILDGCDGEIARFKLLESPFGCWLETICDYLYYVFIYAGMMIGLTTTFGSKVYFVWGALFLVGAILTFLISLIQRHQMTNGSPEQLLEIWQRKAEARRSNPLLYIGRHTEFLIRRCFLPYAILFFSLLNMTKVAFVLSAVGVNVAWFITLYSCWAFSRAQKPRPDDSETRLMLGPPRFLQPVPNERHG